MTEQQTTDETTDVEQTEDVPQTTDTNDESAPVSGETPAETEPETFPREYVQKLRDESAKHRQRAADRDALAERLHVALVAATGRLADPTDLAFDDAHLADEDALAAAIDELLARKPHLASRKPSGDVGQGATLGSDPIDLAGMLRRNAS